MLSFKDIKWSNCNIISLKRRTKLQHFPKSTSAIFCWHGRERGPINATECLPLSERGCNASPADSIPKIPTPQKGGIHFHSLVSSSFNLQAASKTGRMFLWKVIHCAPALLLSCSALSPLGYVYSGMKLLKLQKLHNFALIFKSNLFLKRVRCHGYKAFLTLNYFFKNSLYI